MCSHLHLCLSSDSLQTGILANLNTVWDIVIYIYIYIYLSLCLISVLSKRKNSDIKEFLICLMTCCMCSLTVTRWRCGHLYVKMGHRKSVTYSPLAVFPSFSLSYRSIYIFHGPTNTLIVWCGFRLLYSQSNWASFSCDASVLLVKLILANTAQDKHTVFAPRSFTEEK